MNFADCCTNWNFDFAQTAKIFNTKFTNRLIVNGLPIDTDISDRDSIHHLCVTELGVDPEIVLVNRQGTSSASGRIRPLLVAVGASEVPTKLVEKSCFVNCSVSSTMCNIYIYRNLSKAESKAAYEERCRRQQAAQDRTGTRQPCMRQNGSVDTGSQRDIIIPRSAASLLNPSASVFSSILWNVLPNAIPTTE